MTQLSTLMQHVDAVSEASLSCYRLERDCAPHAEFEEQRKVYASRWLALRDMLDIELQAAENIKIAVRCVHSAKGRYHSQIAMCDLFDLVGLPNERPGK